MPHLRNNRASDSVPHSGQHPSYARIGWRLPPPTQTLERSSSDSFDLLQEGGFRIFCPCDLLDSFVIDMDLPGHRFHRFQQRSQRFLRSRRQQRGLLHSRLIGVAGRRVIRLVRPFYPRGPRADLHQVQLRLFAAVLDVTASGRSAPAVPTCARPPAHSPGCFRGLPSLCAHWPPPPRVPNCSASESPTANVLLLPERSGIPMPR
jgi:hypothetical protein